MTASTLPVATLISVAVNLANASAQAQNLSNLMVVGPTNIIDVVQRYRSYSSLAAVGLDFANNTPEYLSAQAWFAQAPQPNLIYIGRWAYAATHGRLVGGATPSPYNTFTAWTAITTGGLTVTIDGGSPDAVTGLDFSAAIDMNGVASIISAGLTGATCTWNTNYGNFSIISNTTGTTSTVSFATAPGSGVDITGHLAMTNTSGNGAYLANGIAAETALSAVQTMDTLLGQKWYGLFIPTAVDADHLAISPYIEAGTNKHLYGVNTQEAGVISSVSTTDIAYKLKQLNFAKTCVQYSSTSGYAAASLMGRILTTDWNANNTAITLMYKQEPGIVAENLNSTQLAAMIAKNCSAFLAYNNDTAIIQPGVVCSGNYIDTIVGADWLATTIQTALYNQLYTSPTKIPQTDAGTNVLVTAVEQVCAQGIDDGLGAPGQWNQAGFGTLSQGDYLPKGFYVYAPPVASQLQSNRAARMAVPIQVAFKLAGAIQTAGVIVNINP